MVEGQEEVLVFVGVMQVEYLDIPNYVHIPILLVFPKFDGDYDDGVQYWPPVCFGDLEEAGASFVLI